MSYRGFLAELLLAECDDRARRRSRAPDHGRQVPREKPLRGFDFKANPSIDPAVVHTLAKCEWVKKGQPLSKTIARYGGVDLLCIDELGYMQLDRRGAKLLFQVLTECEEKASVAIASNESFSGWTKTFTDPRLCAAIVDRLTFGGTIIETGTDSYRLAQSTKLVNA
jgi:hypothetical protein